MMNRAEEIIKDLENRNIAYQDLNDGIWNKITGVLSGISFFVNIPIEDIFWADIQYDDVTDKFILAYENISDGLVSMAVLPRHVIDQNDKQATYDFLEETMQEKTDEENDHQSEEQEPPQPGRILH